MKESGKKPEMDQGLEWVLGSESPLAAHMPGFAPRPGQRKMAQAVARCLRQEVPLLAEAGTGTGKTLAYLLPAVLSKLKVVVSTGTRTLQDQIAGKEMPLIKAAMAPELTWAVLKGRSNYLCRRRYEDFARRPDLGLPGAQGALGLLKDWLRDSRDGDLDQVRGQGLSEAVLAEVTAGGEQCLAGRCPRREDCFLADARRRAAEADIVLVNHHLFLADLALKSGGHGEALPRYQAVVLDEAHLIPDVATQAFGVSVGQRRVFTLLRDASRLGSPPAGLMPLLMALRAAGDAFFGLLARLLGPGGSRGLSPEDLDMLAEPGSKLGGELEALAAGLGDAPGPEPEALATRALTLSLDLDTVAQPVAGRTVAWALARGSEVAINLSPVEVGPHLDQALYQEMGRLIFTSATLAPLGDLEPMRSRLGLPTETAKLICPSPFDQANQALLYVPKDLAPPTHPRFGQQVAQRVEALLRRSRGRAFLLFTTHRNLKLVAGLLRERLPYPCLVQGEAPRMELLKSFVALSPSVLFATASFWQGVDVPGPALSAVIVDKLPFPPPDDPLVAARGARLEEDGQNSFAHLMIPEAMLSLKQGLGRLLRTPEDRGLLAVLDVRLTSKPYGRRFLKGLAPVPVTHDLEEVGRFFEREKEWEG